ncbi:MAG: S46 family peptidase [Gemmataceae bacterium]
MNRQLLILMILAGHAMIAGADEGMWLLTDPPRDRLKQKYGFELTDDFVKKSMLASVRFNNGGSGGFVSPEGLVVTNHHIAADSVQKLSTPEKNYYQTGFLARSIAEEKKCPDLELNVLQSIEDVTARVNAAVKDGMKPSESAAARRAAMSEIEKESLDKTGLRSDVVTLYQGGLYHLYRYKKYTDVRLVFAPEASIGGFGGDVDNFEYPRYGFDVSFFRVYENGAPAKTPQFFHWSPVGPQANDLAFVTGHPGTTNRLESYAKLIHRRDRSHPYTLARLRAMEAALLQYAETSPEAKRQSSTAIHSVANSRKAFSGQYQGLLTPEILAQKLASETALLKQSPPETTKAIEQIARVQTTLAGFESEYLLFETGHALTSDLFTYARMLVRFADELTVPSARRLREYRDTNLDSMKQMLFSPSPVYKELERVKLSTALTFACETLGSQSKGMSLALGGFYPSARADNLIDGTKLHDVAVRKKLFEGGKAAIDASDDPLIVFAKTIDAHARALRKKYEETVEEPERQAYAEIAKARFAAFGKNVAPDATFTLRLAYGRVSGYRVGGVDLPFHTTIEGAFARSEAMGNHEPFDLPSRWTAAKSKLTMSTPFNFTSTADTIGGNSGSPVLNRAGDLIGVNFDRNRHGLVRNFVYTEEQARHIAVHGLVVLEALDKVYDAKELLKELKGQ